MNRHFKTPIQSNGHEPYEGERLAEQVHSDRNRYTERQLLQSVNFRNVEKVKMNKPDLQLGKNLENAFENSALCSNFALLLLIKILSIV